MSIKSLDEQPGLLRQRRNLILMSVLVIFYSISESQITGISMNGLGLKVGNPNAFIILFMVTLMYFFIRYNSYLVTSNGGGSQKFREIIRSKIPPKLVTECGLQLKNKAEKSIEAHGLTYWYEPDEPVSNTYKLPESIKYNLTGGRESENWTGLVYFPPTLEYKLGIPRWEVRHYDKENEYIFITQSIKLTKYYEIIKSEYKAITREPYYLDFRFPYWLFWLANLSFLFTYLMKFLSNSH
ncbi:hypothetical protein ACM9HF_20005 [Colwellia sp. RE-S-Sl-9]